MRAISKFWEVSASILGFTVASPVGAYTPAEHYTVDSATNTVMDNRTGLIWQRALLADAYSWSDARTACTNLGNGFRLPTLKELLTIVDPAHIGPPAIDATAFPDTPTLTTCWSATPYPFKSGDAYYVDFSMGESKHDGTSTAAAVRCVR